MIAQPEESLFASLHHLNNNGLANTTTPLIIIQIQKEFYCLFLHSLVVSRRSSSTFFPTPARLLFTIVIILLLLLLILLYNYVSCACNIHSFTRSLLLSPYSIIISTTTGARLQQMLLLLLVNCRLPIIYNTTNYEIKNITACGCLIIMVLFTSISAHMIGIILLVF